MRASMTSPTIRILRFALLCLSTTAFAGSSNHGGDGVMITFLKAQPLAAEMVRAYEARYASDDMSNDAFRTWFAQNGAELARDVAESPIEQPTETALNHDALTALTPRAPIRLSLPDL